MPYDHQIPPKQDSGFGGVLALYDELYFSHIRQGAKNLSISQEVSNSLKKMRKSADEKQSRQIEEMLAMSETTATYHWDLRGQLPSKDHLPFFVWSSEDADSREIYLKDGETELAISLEIIDVSAILEVYNLKKFSLEMHFEHGRFIDGVHVEQHRATDPSSVLEAALMASKIAARDQLLAYFTHSNLSGRFKDSCKEFLDHLSAFPQRKIDDIFPSQKKDYSEGFLRSVLFATRTR